MHSRKKSKGLRWCIHFFSPQNPIKPANIFPPKGSAQRKQAEKQRKKAPRQWPCEHDTDTKAQQQLDAKWRRKAIAADRQKSCHTKDKIQKMGHGEADIIAGDPKAGQQHKKAQNIQCGGQCIIAHCMHLLSQTLQNSVGDGIQIQHRHKRRKNGNIISCLTTMVKACPQRIREQMQNSRTAAGKQRPQTKAVIRQIPDPLFPAPDLALGQFRNQKVNESLGNLPLTALQPGIYQRSRVTLTAFGISRTAASASSSARLRVQSFVFILKLLIFLKFLSVCHSLPFAYGFAVIPNGMDI